jgi:hypothetical protein
MLYLTLGQGCLVFLPLAVSVSIDEKANELICLDGSGRVVTVFPRRAVKSYHAAPATGSMSLDELPPMPW